MFKSFFSGIRVNSTDNNDRIPYTGADRNANLGAFVMRAIGLIAGSGGIKILGNYTFAWRDSGDTATVAYMSYGGDITIATTVGGVIIIPANGIVDVYGGVTNYANTILAGCGTGHGRLNYKFKYVKHTTTNAQTNTIAFNVPTNCKIMGCQLRNDTAIDGVDDASGLVHIADYSAEYSGGGGGGWSQVIAGTVGVAQNIKVNKFFEVATDNDVTSDVLTIMVDSRAGNKFAAGGEITAIVYYYEFTDITSIV